MKNNKIILAVLFLLLTLCAYSAPSLRLTTNQVKEFQIGQTFEVYVNLEGNDGAYGVIADVMYDNAVFELIDIFEGTLLPESPDYSELLCAMNPFNETGRVIISNSLVGDQAIFYRNGSMVKLVFKTLRSGADQTITLNPDNSCIYLKNMLKKTVNVINLDGLTVIGPYSNYFVQIISPYNNYKSNVNKIDFHVQGTINNPNYSDTFKIGLKKVTFYDENAPVYSGAKEIFKPLNAGQSYFESTMTDMFTLTPGYNYVVATLYVNNEKKATAVKRVYYETMDRGIVITSPVNNTISGKHTIVITGESSFNNITINNIKVNNIVKISDEKYAFTFENYNLKEGFNKIIARASNPQEPDVIYNHTVVIYYQRDEMIFNFISPEADSVFKSGTVKIMGVIDTIDKEFVQVKMRAHFRPYGVGNDFYYTFTDTDKSNTNITLRELNNDENYLLSHYIFESGFDLDLIKTYGSGELVFYAVKTDKEGKTKDIEISRKIIIDKENLKIDLKQPNLYSEDNLNKKADLLQYTDLQENVDITDEARIILDKKAEPKIIEANELNKLNIKKVITTINKNDYAVINLTNAINIAEKKADGDVFAINSGAAYYYSYANCAVEFGNNSILMGVSDYNTGTGHPSGLLLYNNGIIRYAKLPFEINHVQYIKRIENTYYIYASNYTYMYKINEADVIIDKYNDKYFDIKKVEKFHLPNNLFINSFDVLDGGNTVVLATELGVKIYKYNAGAKSYSLKNEYKKGVDISKLSCIELESGYTLYLFAYKTGSGTDVEYHLSTITEFNSIFKEIDTSLIYKDIYEIVPLENNTFLVYGRELNNSLTVKKVDVIYGVMNVGNSIMPEINNLTDKKMINFTDNTNYYLYGNGLIAVSDEFIAEDGVITLSIDDSKVDGITGFYYDSPAMYESLIKVEYILTNNISDNNYITVNQAGKILPLNKLSRYEVNYKDGYKYLKIKITLKRNSDGLRSSYIENITILKKEIVKITGDKLDIKGFILDKTVGENGFNVNGKIVKLEDNGAFYETLNLNLNEVNNTADVRLYAVNENGETDEIKFRVNYVNNIPDINGISLTADIDRTDLVLYSNLYPIGTDGTSVNNIDVQKENIKLSGNFSGLYGMQVNAEVYTVDQNNEMSKFIRSYAAGFTDEINTDGLVSGKFIFDKIDLIPGVQRIVLKALNPYGAKKEYIFNINFNVASEKIEIINYTLTEINNENYKINEQFGVKKNSDKKYMRTFELQGRVITSKPVDNINLRSDNNYISFTKGDVKDAAYIKVPLNEIGKSFSVYVNIKMFDSVEHSAQYFKIWPDSLQLSDLSENIHVDFTKVFENIIPDFSPTVLDQINNQINLKLKFNEQSPDYKLIRLRLNHQDIAETVYIPLRNISNNYFTLSNGVFSYINPLDAVNGVNILDWQLYQDINQNMIYDEAVDKQLSYSAGDKYAVFIFGSDDIYTDLKVVFPVNNKFYDNALLKQNKLTVDFDYRGTLEIYLNDQLIEKKENGYINKAELDLTQYASLIEGINKISVHYVYEAKNTDQYLSDEFKYDSKIPDARITSRDSIDDFVNPYIKTITCEVKEKNLHKVNLVYNGSVVDKDPAIKITGDDTFVYSWNNLESLNILPASNRQLYVEAFDITGKKGVSQIIDSGLSLYYDIQISNKLSDTKVLNLENNGSIEISGTDDAKTDYSQYWNEGNKIFDFHLKYEATELFDENQLPLREDITENFNKEKVFNSLKKYLMFEFDSYQDYINADLAFSRINTITKKAALRPVDFLYHIDYTWTDQLDSFDLNKLIDEKKLYSKIEGYAAKESQYIGIAKDIKIYNDYALVLDLVNQTDMSGSDYSDNSNYDYKAIIIYELLKSRLVSQPNVPGIPKIAAVIDGDLIKNITNYKIYDNFLYAVCGDDGLLIYDLAKLNVVPLEDNLIFPLASKIDTFNTCRDFVKIGNYLYIATSSGIDIYNISDIVNPFIVNQIENNLDNLSINNDDNTVYLLNTNNNVNSIAKYSVNNQNMTLLNTGTINKNINYHCRLWMDTNYLYILPQLNSKVLIYNKDLIYNSEITDAGNLNNVNNTPIDSHMGILYPCDNNIIISGQTVSTNLTLDSERSYGVAINKGVLYSANGKKGIKIIAADNEYKEDFTTVNNNIPNGWQNNETDLSPIYIESLTETVGTETITTTGILNMPLNINITTGLSQSSGIKKDLNPTIYINPDKLIKVKFKLISTNLLASSVEIILKLQNNGYVSKNYYSTSLVSSPNDSITYELVDSAVWVEKSFKLSDFGIDSPDRIESIIIKNNPLYSNTGGTKQDICLMDYLIMPVYNSFNIPLTHIAFKIDENVGDHDDRNFNLDLFKSTEVDKIITESGKVIVYIPVDKDTADDIVEKKYNLSKANNSNVEGLMNIEFNNSYFTERMELYKTGQCPDDQYDNSIDGANLNLLNNENSAKFTKCSAAFLDTIAKSESKKVVLGASVEELTLYNFPEKGKYKIYLTDTLIVQPETDGERIDEKTSKEIHITRSKNGAISFWLKLEDEIPWFMNFYNNYQPWGDYNSLIGKSLVSWGSDNNADCNYRFVLYPDKLDFVQYKLGSGLNKTESDIETGNRISAELDNTNNIFYNSYGSWMLVTLTWDYTGALVMYVNNKRVNENPILLNNFNFDKFLYDRVVFGDAGQDVGSLYYSVASPKIFNRTLSDKDISALYYAANRLQGQGSDIKILFDNNLNIIKDAGALDEIESDNAYYEDTINNKGIVVSKGIKNYIGNNENYLKLTNNVNYTNLIKENANCVYDSVGDILTIQKDNPLTEGAAYYHMTDGSTSGLGIPGAESYTFFGTITNTDIDKDDYCIIKINGVENKFALKTGDFKYTVSGINANLSAIDIYFVFKNKVSFKRSSLGFNTARYKGNNYESYPVNHLRVKHKFYHKESVVVYYKPFFSSNWELNNEEITIVDSKLYKIGISANKYYAELKTVEGVKRLTSDTEMTGDLHQIALVYDFSSLTFKLYVDAKLEASYSGTTFTMPVFVGSFPEVYNMTIGGNMDDSVKAQGIIDQFEIYPEEIIEGKILSDYAKYCKIINIDTNPIFNSPDVSINLKNNITNNIKITYYFDNENTLSEANIGSLGEYQINKTFAIGLHSLKMQIEMLDNADNVILKKSEEYNFFVNYAPIVKITDSKTIILKGDKEIIFNLERDFENRYAENEKFVVLELYLSGNLADIDSKKVQTINEDRLLTNYGKYYRDNDYSTLSSDIKFIINDDIPANTGYIYYKIKAYYYQNQNNTVVLNGEIKVMDITEPEITNDKFTNRPWIVNTKIANYNKDTDNSKGLKCDYKIIKLDKDQTYKTLESGSLSFNLEGLILINVYQYADPGNYIVSFTPVDEKGNKGTVKEASYTLTENMTAGNNEQAGDISISELNLIYIDKDNHSAKFNFAGNVENNSYNITAALKASNAEETKTLLTESNLTDKSFNRMIDITELAVGVDYEVSAKIIQGTKTVEKTSYFKYEGISVDVKITHGPLGYISYNNVYFNWEGYLNNDKDSRVKYRFSIDNSPWSETNNNHVEFYYLEDGGHSFEVQAYYEITSGTKVSRVYSGVKSNTFVIDTQKPVIDSDKLHVEVINSEDGKPDHLKLTAEKNAVSDSTLAGVLVNENVVEVKEGGFTVDNIGLDIDGLNEIKIKAIDLLGNITEAVKSNDFKVLQIEYPFTITNFENPDENDFVKYSPLTVYGYISDNITIDDNFSIYVEDPYGIRKAVINFDRTFFIENVKVNPGTKFKAIKTELKFTSDLGNGKKIVKTYPVYAKGTIKPIELQLSVHAVSGGADTTEVKMTAITDVSNPATWEFDYDGDGVFDEEIYSNQKEITVFYKYSTVGIIHPRVRVITQDNHFFSGEDTLIIHDKIIKADLKDILGAKSLDIIEVDDPNDAGVDGYEYVYVLQKVNNSNVIKRYVIEANSAVLMDINSININLTQLGINYPRALKVDQNQTIYISALYGTGSKIYKLIKSTSSYIIDKNFNITLNNEIISSFDIDKDYIYMTLETKNEILKYKKDGVFVKRLSPLMDNIIENTDSDAGIEVYQDKIWLGDCRKQRVIALSSDSFKLRDFFGEAGNEEGQFITPKIVRVKGNFIYVMDQSEYTLQVFEKTDDKYRIICRIDNTNDYLPQGFLSYITDFAVFTKIESQKAYQYIALVNNQGGQIALLRIPKWQANSVKLKTNLITYVNNNEIFTSKPDGSDVRKLFSSGSLPGVDGNVDYPSIGPDGATLSFVSKIERYEYINEDEGYVFRKYDKLYLMDAQNQTFTLISGAAIDGKEIDRPQFSYNGSKLIFSAKKSGEYWTIYVYDMKTKEITKLFTPSNDCMRPTYSPDDRYIAYVTKFHNHNEIMIYDTENPELLISLTSNDYSDDYPVWSPVYQGEIADEQLYIKSKIAFVSKPDFKEKIFYTYISQRTFGDFRVVKKDGTDIGADPDKARNELSINYDTAGTVSYPCFTGDGKTLIFETYKDGQTVLMQYDMSSAEHACVPTGVKEGSRRPSGMKNRIVNFEANPVDGNNIQLSWDRYAKEDLIYTVQYISNENNAQLVEKSFTSQNHAIIEDLKMGVTYWTRVYVKDLLRNEEVTSSVWKKAVIYPVIAKPIITIDDANPYLVKLKAWKPETDKPWEYDWKFKWFIDNYEVKETFSEVVEYEFAAAGEKRIALEASISTAGSKTHRSEDVIINIKGDLKPDFKYEIIEENGSVSVKLDASLSKGRKLDKNNYKWKLSGSNVNGNIPPEEFAGEVVVRNLDNYKGNVYVTLTASSLPVTGQVETIREEKSYIQMIPLGLREIKPAITETIDSSDKTLYTFDGSISIGNIDWTSSAWEVFGPDNLYYQTQGKSGFTYNFPDKNDDTDYTVVLTARNRSTNATVSLSKRITVGNVPVEPVIDYKVITVNENGEVVTAKLLLSSANSKGNDIDWNNVRWSVPLAGDYGASSTQVGATAVYNLYNIKKNTAIDVSLTMQRRSSSDIIEAGEVIVIKNNEVPSIEPFVEVIKQNPVDLYQTQEGDVYIFSALKSKGANIDWNNVNWLIDNQYARQGATVRFDLKDMAEKQNVVVTLTLKSTGGGAPVTKTVSFNAEAKILNPVITSDIYLDDDGSTEKNIAQLSVKDTIGQNIDWERTRWFIYQGPENIVEKYGAEIIHSFPVSNDVEYYPVIVQMFYKGNTKPYAQQKNIRVKGDKLQAIVKEVYDEELTELNKYTRTFTAADSLGENIDWQNCKWTFGDSSEYQYGPVVVHKFPYDKGDAAYMVTLTAQRRTKDGTTEISTDTYNVSIGKDQVEAMITIKTEGNYVVFSAEDSKGRGLLLDRSMWMFEGADNENYNESTSESDSYSVSNTDSFSYNIGTNIGIGIETGWEWCYINKVSVNFGFNWGWNWGSSTSDSDTETDTFSQSSGESSNNLYSGASCRKMIDGWKYKKVTLVVYRMLPDGSIEGQTKTITYKAGETGVK